MTWGRGHDNGLLSTQRRSRWRHARQHEGRIVAFSGIHDQGHKGGGRVAVWVQDSCCRQPTTERVLRYPDGHERRIRYPCPELDCENSSRLVGVQEGVLDVEASMDLEYRGDACTWNRGLDECEEMYTTDEEEQSSDSNFFQAFEKRETGTKEKKEATASQIPDSPLELLRVMTSDSFKEKQRKEWEDVLNSFEIHHGCPWPVPKPLYTILIPQSHGDHGVLYTLRTRVPQPQVESEINSVLRLNKKRRRNQEKESPIIRCSSMVDGLIAFEDEDMAHDFGAALESLNGTTVSIGEHDSHKIFRDIQSARGVIVVLKRGAVLPGMSQLAAALKSPEGHEDTSNEL